MGPDRTPASRDVPGTSGGARTTPPPSGDRRRLGVTLVLFALALVPRLWHVGELHGTAFEDERDLVSDSRYYDKRAREIAAGDLVGSTPGFLSPTYCDFLGAVYALTGGSLLAAKLVQAVLGAATVALAHRVGRRVFSETAGVLAALLLAGYGLLVYYTALLLPTTLVAFLHALLLWILVRARAAPNGATPLLAGLVAGLAIGTKANALLLLPAVAGWLLLGFRATPLKRRAAAVLLLVLGAGATVAPITWRNWATSGELVLVTTTGGRNLLKGNGPTATGTHRMLAEETVHIGHYLEDRVDVAEVAREDRELTTEAWDAILGDPWRALGLFATKLGLFFHHAEVGIRDSYPYMRTHSALLGMPVVTYGLVAPLGLVGFLLTVGRDRGTALTGLLLATQVASFVLVFVLARYRVVAVSCLALFAGALAVRVAAALRERRWSRAALPVLLVVPAAWFVHRDLSHLEGFDVQEPVAEQHRFVGDWHFGRGEWREALREYDRAIVNEWRLLRVYDLWEVRDRIGDCWVELGQEKRAEKIWEVLLAEMETALPARPLELKETVRAKLERQADP